MPDRPGRLLELVHLLSGRRSRSLREIADHFAVSDRTAYRDLASLEERQIPITHDDRGYRLLETAKLQPLNLTAEERAVLRLALDNPLLKRRPSLRKPLATVTAKLDKATKSLSESPEALAVALGSVDRTGRVEEEIVDVLRQSIEQQRSIYIQYTSLTKGRRRWRRVDPYKLVHRADAWYLPAHCHRNRELRLFRLDRITGVKPTQDRFEVSADFDLETLFEHSWSVYRGGRRNYTIVLHFDGALGALLENAQHHHRESIQKLVDGDIEYRVTLSHLDEVARWVVGFGGACRVIEPEALRQKVAELAQGALERT